MGSQGGPKGAKESARELQGLPNRAKPRRDKRSPMASQRDPKEPPGTEKEVQRKPIYIKTPDQPHNGRYVLFQSSMVAMRYFETFTICFNAFEYILTF